MDEEKLAACLFMLSRITDYLDAIAKKMEEWGGDCFLRIWGNAIAFSGRGKQ
jgi:hypothetical protein